MPIGGSSRVLASVARYYTNKIDTHGPTPWGVDWPCALTQDLRFVQLLKVCGRRRSFSLNDLGCGYGALLSFIGRRYGTGKIDYAGVDISPSMISHALQLWGDRPSSQFSVSSELPRIAQFSVASGLFNVRLESAARTWTIFIEDVLGELHRASRLGFAVNFILPAPAGTKARPGLYRTLPEPWVAYCRKAFRADVAVVENYGLREFTLLVRSRPAPKPR